MFEKQQLKMAFQQLKDGHGALLEETVKK